MRSANVWSRSAAARGAGRRLAHLVGPSMTTTMALHRAAPRITTIWITSIKAI